jgi:predicted AlkP superfamily pyrophosphatase or phosphodiesterase
MQARTVTPSVTLPCHMSLFHSVPPARHGTTTNVYAPQVRPVRGLCEVLSKAEKKCAFFYEWLELRDLVRPGSLAFSYFCSGRFIGREAMNDKTAAAAKRFLAEEDFDFAFLYLGYTDWAGHAYGWMSPEYLYAMRNSWRNIEMVLSSLSEEYTVIITADHGGHGRTHGTEMPEDMTIPLFMLGNGIEKGLDLTGATILDVAPTVAKLLEVAPDAEWEGHSLI